MAYNSPPVSPNGRGRFLSHRVLARADLGGNSVEEAFLRVDERGKDSVSRVEFWKVRHQWTGLRKEG